jgi:hypothetical protein
LSPAVVNSWPGHISFAIKILTVDGGRISGIVGFVTPHLFPAFGLPDRLAG